MRFSRSLLLAMTTSAALFCQSGYAADLTPAQEGRKLFLRMNCYGCHGMHGLGGMGPRLVGEGHEVAEAVTEGKHRGMRSFSKYLSPQDIGNLTAYVSSLGTADEPVFVNWWEDVPSE